MQFRNNLSCHFSKTLLISVRTYRLVCLRLPYSEQQYQILFQNIAKMSASLWVFTVNLYILVSVKTIAAVSDARLAQVTNILQLFFTLL